MFPDKISCGSHVVYDDVMIGQGNCKFVSCHVMTLVLKYTRQTILYLELFMVFSMLSMFCLDRICGYIYVADDYGN